MNDDQRAFIRRLVAEVLDGLLNAPESDALDPRLSIAGGGTVTVSVLRVGSEDGPWARWRVIGSPLCLGRRK